MRDEKLELLNLVNSIYFNENLFVLMFGEDKFIMGAEFIDQPENKFFMYKTIYDTIIDLDEKIKKSFRLAIEWEYQSDIKEFTIFG